MDHEHRNDINDVANSIDEFVTDKTEDLLRICHDLTECNSINPPGSTVETAQVIQDFFKKNVHGILIFSIFFHFSQIFFMKLRFF